MVSSYQMNVFRILNLHYYKKGSAWSNYEEKQDTKICWNWYNQTVVHLKGKKQGNGLQAVLSSINIVSQKQVVNIPVKLNVGLNG